MSGVFKRIMLATDFSDASKKALDYAVQLAHSMDARLRIVHVFNPDVWEFPSSYYMMSGSDTWLEEQVRHTREYGKKALHDWMLSVSGVVDSCFAEGRPAEMIVQEAKEWNADLLVLGSHGYTGRDRAVLGSVTDKVISASHCAVLAIKPDGLEEA